MRKAKFWFRDAEETWADLEEHNPHHAKYRIFTMKILKPHGKRCLDLGCGLGRYLRDYAKYGASKVVGLDINLKNLKKCRKKDAFIIRGDIENLGIKEEYFDVVSCIATMEHLPNPQKAMEEICRVMKKRGLACVTWNNYNWLWAIRNKVVRQRLIGYIRDLLGMFMPLLRKERVHRNSCFSLKEIKKLHRYANMQILNEYRYPAMYVITISQPIINES